MSCNGTLTEAAAATHATVCGQAAGEALPYFAGVSTDSRAVVPGNLFVALCGDRFDGHEFAARAVAQGAVAAVVAAERAAALIDLLPAPLLVVDDTLAAYQALARWWRDRSGVPVVAVTGSAGKTTTKEAIAALLAFYVRPGRSVCKSEANFNNDIGAAKTLLEIDPSRHDVAVLEMGMRGLGEIARLTAMAQPTVGVITNIGTAHIGRLGSQAAIATAKCELLAQLPATGVAVLNAEDELLQAAAARVWTGRTVTFGLDRGDVRGTLAGNRLHVGDAWWPLPLPGRHNALNFLAGLAVLQALGLDRTAIAGKPLALDLPPGRSRLLALAGETTLIDETYNASPEATVAALRLLAQTPARRRWAALGAMKELGEASAELHGWVGRTVAELGIDGLAVLADGEAEAIAVAARQARADLWVDVHSSHDDLARCLLDRVLPGDAVLFKASRSVAMDRAVAAFAAGWLARHGAESPASHVSSHD